jgi:hypothetical protein
MTVIKLPKLNIPSEQKQFLLPAGTFTMVVQEVRQTKVKTGVNQGKPALNVAFVHEGVWVWKQLPMWALAKTAPQNEKDWFRMSTVAFLNAIGHTDDELDIEALIGQEVTAIVGVQNNGADYGSQNYIVTFTTHKK